MLVGFALGSGQHPFHSSNAGQVGNLLPPPREPGSAYADLAVSCLVLGKTSPGLLEHSPDRLDSIVEPIAWIFEMYQGGEFESYLHFHRADLSSWEEPDSETVSALSEIVVNQFGRPAGEIPTDFLGALGHFWALLYSAPALVEVFPASAQLELRAHVGDWNAFDSSSFRGSFEEKRRKHPVRMSHRVSIPHGRSVEAIVRDSGKLTWFDFQVDVTLGEHEQLAGGILLRFVWDDMAEEYFLLQAVTIYPDDFVLGRSKSVLLY